MCLLTQHRDKQGVCLIIMPNISCCMISLMLQVTKLYLYPHFLFCNSKQFDTLQYCALSILSTIVSDPIVNMNHESSNNYMYDN